MQKIFLFLFIFISEYAFANVHTISGRVFNKNLQPISYATVRIKNQQIGTETDAKGYYSFMLEDGTYELVVSMIGYNTLTVAVLLDKQNYTQNILLELAGKELKTAIISATKKDISEEIVKNVIENKDRFLQANTSFSCKMYIKALQEASIKKSKKIEIPKSDSLAKADSMQASKKYLQTTCMAEIAIQLDCQYPNKIKEERIGVKKIGRIDDLFYLSRTVGDFNFYKNLVDIPKLSETPFLSPISYSGLLAYRFKMLSITTRNGRKYYRIKVTPAKSGNALVEGEMVIADSLWAMESLKFELPNHLIARYKYFSIEQNYTLSNDKNIALKDKEKFTYESRDNTKATGTTSVYYTDYKTDTIFPKKYFGEELSSTSEEAYKRDSIFWQKERLEPLSEKEVKVIHYTDSIYTATHNQKYYDSIDARANKLRLVNFIWKGQENYNRKLERRIYFPTIFQLYNPLPIGGTRLGGKFYYYKKYKNFKNIVISPMLTYGLLNQDLLGQLSVSHLYNPFKLASVSIIVGKQTSNYFSGDAIVNLIQRTNLYLNTFIKINNRLEIKNGLYINDEIEFAQRSSLYNYKTTNIFDSLINGKFGTNRPADFATYNSMYHTLGLEYTYKQMYVREPHQKVVLGSKYPTLYARWKMGVPSVFNSLTNFQFISLGVYQVLKLGTAGKFTYNIKYGNFLSKSNLQLVDYNWMRRGEPFLFYSPEVYYQSLDSTFPVLKGNVQAHCLHEFNGSLINKIPYAKVLKITEIAGGGFCFVPERNLQYVETFFGLEKQFTLFNQPLKFGTYFVSSFANKFNNPYQIKFGLKFYNKLTNLWE